MDLLAQLLLLISLQLLLGRAVLLWLAVAPGGRDSRRRRRWATWIRSERSLRGSTLSASLAALACAAFLALRPAGFDARCAALMIPGTLATSGGYLLVHAGWCESRGRLRLARRQGRAAGLLMVSGLSILLLLAGALAAWHPTLLPRSVAPLAGAASIALLAALSGKPRPSGSVALLLYAGSQLALVASLSG